MFCLTAYCIIVEGFILLFSDISLSYSILLQVCNRKYDYVEISGSSAISTEEKLLGRFCGAMDFKLIVSPSTKMTIEFNSDETVSGKGFRAVFVQGKRSLTDFI